jgi:hypothetical protein
LAHRGNPRRKNSNVSVQMASLMLANKQPNMGGHLLVEGSHESQSNMLRRLAEERTGEGRGGGSKTGGIGWATRGRRGGGMSARRGGGMSARRGGGMSARRGGNNGNRGGGRGRGGRRGGRGRGRGRGGTHISGGMSARRGDMLPSHPSGFVPAPVLNVRMAQSERAGGARGGGGEYDPYEDGGDGGEGEEQQTVQVGTTKYRVPPPRSDGVNSSSGSKTSRTAKEDQKRSLQSKASAWARARAHVQNGGGGTNNIKNMAPEYTRSGPSWDGLAKHGHSQFRWRRGPLLGRGRFGSVFMAMNVENGELIAVKQVNVESTSDKKMLQREISLMRSMSMKSPNIVRCLATELVSGVFNIFMEYVPGGSLKHLLKEFGPLSELVVQSYCLQVLTGLRVLHDAGIAHRDIKADNLLLADDGTVKLADFGSAKRISMSSMMMQTNAEQIRGSPLWMSPEVIRNEVGGGKNIKGSPTRLDQRATLLGWRRADVWSFGCTVIELINGKPPFDYFSNPTAAMFHIASCKEPPIKEFPKTMDLDMGHDMLGRCFALTPEERPSVHELLIHPYWRKVPVGASISSV